MAQDASGNLAKFLTSLPNARNPFEYLDAYLSYLAGKAPSRRGSRTCGATGSPTPRSLPVASSPSRHPSTNPDMWPSAPSASRTGSSSGSFFDADVGGVFNLHVSHGVLVEVVLHVKLHEPVLWQTERRRQGLFNRGEDLLSSEQVQVLSGLLCVLVGERAGDTDAQQIGGDSALPGQFKGLELARLDELEFARVGGEFLERGPCEIMDFKRCVSHATRSNSQRQWHRRLNYINV